MTRGFHGSGLWSGSLWSMRRCAWQRLQELFELPYDAVRCLCYCQDEMEARYRSLFQQVDLTKDTFFSYSLDPTQHLQKLVRFVSGDPAPPPGSAAAKTAAVPQPPTPSSPSASTQADSAPKLQTLSPFPPSPRRVPNQTDEEEGDGTDSDHDAPRMSTPIAPPSPSRDRAPSNPSVDDVPVDDKFVWTSFLMSNLQSCVSDKWLVPVVLGSFEQVGGVVCCIW